MFTMFFVFFVKAALNILKGRLRQRESGKTMLYLLGGFSLGFEYIRWVLLGIVPWGLILICKSSSFFLLAVIFAYAKYQHSFSGSD
jgi:hypothetical protein